MSETKTSFEVTREDSFEVAIRLINLGYHPVVLDFASGTNPGGGWRGKQTGTQEESLCRRSNLGLLLEKKKYPIPVNGLIYVPKVVITKDIDMNPIKDKECAVIASELKSINNRTLKYLQKRVSDLYTTAVKNKHDAIVLGFWGLGAFKECDEDVPKLAEAMRICAKIYKDQVKTTFALYKGKKNYDLFVKELFKS